jgi:hypothetical protein
MISEDRVKGSLGIGIGMLMAVGMSLLASRVPQGVLWALWVPSTAVFVTGCAFYSRSKGYSPYLGVLGFGWIFGLIALIFLKDRNDNSLKELQAEFEARRKARSKQPLP